MNCTKPKTAYWSGHLNGNGNQYLVFDKNKSMFGIEQTIPCRGCIPCRINHAAQWGRRAMDENRFHEESFFGTFTYSPENLPVNGTLNSEDFQKFMKRLRKNTGAEIRYLQCGEYGDKEQPGYKFGRPHHHALIYGWRPGDEEVKEESEGILTYSSEILDEYWSNGITTTGDLTEASAQYVSQYVMKKIGGQLADDHYQTTCQYTGDVIQMKREYITMSKGIGQKFYKEFKSDMYPSDQKVHNGKVYGVPRYYDKLLDRENPKMLEQVKHKRKQNALKQRHDNTPERLAVKNKIAELNQKRRSANRGKI